MSEHELKDPSTLTFEGPYIRRCILTSYLALVILALPLWWSTTSIERLSLPTSRIDSLAPKEVRHLARLRGYFDISPKQNIQAPFAHNCRR